MKRRKWLANQIIHLLRLSLVKVVIYAIINKGKMPKKKKKIGKILEDLLIDFHKTSASSNSREGGDGVNEEEIKKIIEDGIFSSERRLGCYLIEKHSKKVPLRILIKALKLRYNFLTIIEDYKEGPAKNLQSLWNYNEMTAYSSIVTPRLLEECQRWEALPIKIDLLKEEFVILTKDPLEEKSNIQKYSDDYKIFKSRIQDRLGEIIGSDKVKEYKIICVLCPQFILRYYLKVLQNPKDYFSVIQ